MSIVIIGIVLANSLLFIPTALLAFVLYKAARNGLQQYQVIKDPIDILTCSIDTDCPPDHVCIKGRCIPEAKLEELLSSMA